MSQFNLLSPSEVPDFPASNQWRDILRWCVAVMNDDDDDIGFVASLLSHACSKGGITEKQAKYGKRIVDRVHALWMAEQLACQRTGEVVALTDQRLSDLNPKGNA